MADKASKFEIHEAARNGRTNVVESLLNANSKLATLKDDDDRLPLHWAVAQGHLDVVSLLAQRKDFDPDTQDGAGWTPLMIAVSLREGEDIVKLLLSKGADVSETNNNGQTAIFFATSKNNLDIAKALLENKPPASVRVKDKRGQYPIHRAASIGSVPLVELLLKNRSPLNATDSAGYTPLHHAIAEGHGDTALALLKAGAETDKKDVDGFLAIDLAPDGKVRKFILESIEREGIELTTST
ncbi:hypothetical protein V500_05437 [Pseudogymnoascus sp. VKM F-4518 (FW-2643)]|nr:hypothetical protein V500_05437 [Pseudogymnoascus sp. VKM F-4518 (FW-2643)]